MKIKVNMMALIGLLLISLCINSRHRLSMHLKQKLKTHMKLKQKSRMLKQDPPAEGGEEGAAGAEEKKEPTLEEKLAVQKEGWLQVSTQSFADEKRYPIVKGTEKNSFKMVEMTGGYISVSEGTTPSPDTVPGSYFRKNEQFVNGGPPNDSSFYFRLSGLNLYYTATDKDMVVLGAIKVANLQTVIPADSAYVGFCISVKDIELDEWTLCAPAEEEIKDWKCKIQTVLGLPCEDKKEEEEEEKVAQPVYVVSTPSPYCNENWNLRNKGDDWQCLCIEGLQQSPINLRKYCQVPGMVKEQKYKLNTSAIFQFAPVNSEEWQLIYEDYTVKMTCVEDKGCKGGLGKVIDTDYSEFEGREVHFKTPSEHTINGQYYPMEVQAIYHPISQQAFRDKLIISWLVTNVPGGTNQFLQQFDVLNLPHKNNPKAKITDKPIQINLQGMFITPEVEKFSDYFSYYYYMGSMTIPQCDEHVRWIVVAEPIPLGISIYQMFNDANGKGQKNYQGNNRQIQERHNRDINFFDAEQANCGELVKMKPAGIDGHFEKLESKIYDIQFVGGDKPSKLKGTKVVDDKKLELIRKERNQPHQVEKILKS